MTPTPATARAGAVLIAALALTAALTGCGDRPGDAGTAGVRSPDAVTARDVATVEDALRAADGTLGRADRELSGD